MIKKGWTINLLAGILLMLGACANQSDEENDQQEIEAEAKSSSQSEVTIDHLKGEITFDQIPEDIVVLDVQYLDHLLALGKQPIGTVYAGTDQGLPEYLGELPGDPTLLGTYEEPNVEQILSLEPDLIIATDAHEDMYDQLNSIAPTLVFDRMEDWKDVQLNIGKLLDEQEQSQKIVDDYNEKVSGLKEELADKMEGETVALIRPRDDMIRLHTTDHRTAEILYNDLGLTPPELAEGQADTSSMISIEILPEMDADHFFLLQDATNAELTADFMDTSVWKGLKAVTEDQVYEKDTALWVGYYSPIALNIVVDEIAEELN
ncbi:ABC transporter substrate-binding protein [Alkalicoccobacillus porphyridii]|uniref:Iron-siderophore ABC transporter substrate-binding protein n=1 Tax=Alkalicoccobacillus porphyridii TaxID=2597270 RepID=A0A554A102_9BACI|nr:iron-siderophore ABC transporter substrate-binding protein [Alkalicoccobacillus porphyridii]TSB47369.1 iron-siderophore ABC transporter substrate-binding protein [Alkalicoccobacillus porphyridii]